MICPACGEPTWPYGPETRMCENGHETGLVEAGPTEQKLGWRTRLMLIAFGGGVLGGACVTGLLQVVH